MGILLRRNSVASKYYILAIPIISEHGHVRCLHFLDLITHKCAGELSKLDVCIAVQLLQLVSVWIISTLDLMLVSASSPI
jgi:hypothetical protein